MCGDPNHHPKHYARHDPRHGHDTRRLGHAHPHRHECPLPDPHGNVHPNGDSHARAHTGIAAADDALLHPYRHGSPHPDPERDCLPGIRHPGPEPGNSHERSADRMANLPSGLPCSVRFDRLSRVGRIAAMGNHSGAVPRVLRRGGRRVTAPLFAAFVVAGLFGLAGGAAESSIHAQGRPQAVARMYLRPALVPSLTPGGLLRMEVWLDDPFELMGFQFTLTYDSEVLEYEEATLGPLLGSSGREIVEFPAVDRAGAVSYGAQTLPGRPGASVSGLLAVITMRAIGEGTSTVGLEDVEVTDTANAPIPVTVGPPSRVAVRGEIFLPFGLAP